MRTPEQVAEELIPESLDMLSEEQKLCHLQQNGVVLGVRSRDREIAKELRRIIQDALNKEEPIELMDLNNLIKELDGVKEP